MNFTTSCKPRLAVVVPAYNAEAWIVRALSSLLAQMIENLTIVVIDDGSSDGTVELVHRRFGDKVLLETGPNRGACHARNRGLDLVLKSGAEYVLFLDADDYVEGDYLGAAIEAAASGADLLLGRIERRRNGRTVHVREVTDADLNPESAFSGWLAGPQINPAGLFFRSDFLNAIGGWKEDVLINQDAEVVLRALLQRPVIMRVERGCGVYVLGHASLSSRHSEAKLSNYVNTLEELLRAADEAGFGADLRPLEDTLYGVARMAFRQGWVETGRRALAVLHARGVRRHPGSLMHRLVSRAIGLERKVQFFGGRRQARVQD